MVILFFADIFGKPGRKAVASLLPELKREFAPDFIIGNAENLAGGRGVNKKIFLQMLEMGFHGFTSGNHIWDNRDVYSFIDTDSRLIRPANYPSSPTSICPGRGYTLLQSGEQSLFVINIMGRVFMDSIDCPFRAVDEILESHRPTCPVLVDMHGDATSEKYAMGWHLAGRVSAMVGSHSHVQTADERILPGGTAYITDVGMSGSFDSVIGLKPEAIIKKFITKRAHRYEPAITGLGVCCVVIRIGADAKAQSIERIRRLVELSEEEKKELLES